MLASTERSGAFWPGSKHLQAAFRGPRAAVAVLENVTGLLTSRGGRDSAAVGEAFASWTIASARS